MSAQRDIKSYQVGLWQAKTYRILTKITTDYLDQYNLTPAEWVFLGTTYDAGEGGITQKELADELGTSEPFVARTTKKMLSEKLVSSNDDESDKRINRLCITKKGEKFIDEHEMPLRVHMRSSLGKLPRPQLFGYVQTIKAISEIKDIDTKPKRDEK